MNGFRRTDAGMPFGGDFIEVVCEQPCAPGTFGAVDDGDGFFGKEYAWVQGIDGFVVPSGYPTEEDVG